MVVSFDIWIRKLAFNIEYLKNDKVLIFLPLNIAITSNYYYPVVGNP